MSVWPFKRNAPHAAAETLLEAVVAASRRPDFYGAGRVPDTLEGRFELITLNAALALVRLKAAAEAAGLAQLFTDRLFRHFDAGLREAGIGDLIVPKRMNKMAGAFYGRLGVYGAALDAHDLAALAAALGRNILADEAAPFAVGLARYALASAKRQAGQAVEALSGAEAWTAEIV